MIVVCPFLSGGVKATHLRARIPRFCVSGSRFTSPAKISLQNRLHTAGDAKSNMFCQSDFDSIFASFMVISCILKVTVFSLSGFKGP